ncbi:hypothetical protein TEA_002717 [Camellia sinensis var. sinensis]|uniref:BCAS3 domain-containing protein n=1 Tax=Camellia sinensis var. sinensis TaxID=542762 RepID=A0A4S4D0F4_CAMSN|nr:hypothetical protein TEA_002717 [Camellia sinensis var. sinensis]
MDKTLKTHTTTRTPCSRVVEPLLTSCPHGLCAFSPSLDGCFLALPASTTKGSVLVYNVMERHSHCEIDAHRSPLAAMVLSSSGMYIATASEQGTIIRVHLVSDATKAHIVPHLAVDEGRRISYSFRRGTYPSTIFSLSFGPSMQLPDILVATSSSGSVHAFPLGFALNQRSRRPSSFLGSIIPESVNDASAHHHVLHNASPARVKSITAKGDGLCIGFVTFILLPAYAGKEVFDAMNDDMPIFKNLPISDLDFINGSGLANGYCCDNQWMACEELLSLDSNGRDDSRASLSTFMGMM